MNSVYRMQMCYINELIIAKEIIHFGNKMQMLIRQQTNKQTDIVMSVEYNGFYRLKIGFRI